ncbi:MULTISPECIES: gamma-glutamylcyclotransferase family protein [unclassified Actinopolyspora]|uniref:gamma-glutamylcyclotransferase family protein n=1 Tax=Actinopolyspora TaxID=1849 RepID=UPI0013F5B2B2|nr:MULTISPECIES: gamma-glutamylcyclotransferase family protein [unclassified Actinopolyspora]NHD16834.1 gamma-glutamylcyclotransferase [Actinopolyspora sp. BKK2]NHE75986.1 gamma-glutamylcyclotransferase [Actinopolyspora sp. BKK1]
MRDPANPCSASPGRRAESSRTDFPEHIAVYGTLRSNGSASGLLAELVAAREGDTTLPGVLYDTGRGYPAFVLERFPPRPSREPAERGVPAEVYRLRDPRSALPVLDDYEGPEYERLVLDLDAERSCWVYVWRPPVEGMRRIFGGWTESCRQHPRDG